MLDALVMLLILFIAYLCKEYTCYFASPRGFDNPFPQAYDKLLCDDLQKLAAKVAALEQQRAEALALEFAELNQQAAQVGAYVQSPFEQVLIVFFTFP